MPKFQAYQQGKLDGLCGLYSLINAKRLLFPRMSIEESRYLFFESLSWIKDNTKWPEVFLYGMGVNTLVGLSKEIIEPTWPEIQRSRPFYRGLVTLDEYWDGLAEYASNQPSSIIVLIETRFWGHWTVVSSVQKHRLNTFDSRGRKCIFKHHCTLGEMTDQTPVLLYPHYTQVYHHL